MTPSTRKSLILSLVIAATFGALSLRENHLAGALRREREELRARASSLGIDPNDSNDSRAKGPRSKRSLQDSEAEAMKCFRELSAFLKTFDEENSEEDAETQQRMLDLLESLYRLDADQARIVVNAFKNDASLDENIRETAIGACLMILGSRDPAAAITIFSESEPPEDDFFASSLTETFVAKWAEQDPLATFEWIRNRQKSHPEADYDETIHSLIRGTAAQNPKLAFRFIEELQLEDPESAILQIGAAARSPEQRDALLQTLSELGNNPANASEDEFSATTRLPTLMAMSEPLLGEGFESATSWIRNADLDEHAKSAVIGELSYYEARGETGQWLDWIAENLSPEDQALKTADLMASWTRDDHRAAGSWLAAKPNDPSRASAVSAYALTIAPYDFETAAKWAATLPDPEARNQLLEEIREAAEAESPSD